MDNTAEKMRKQKLPSWLSPRGVLTISYAKELRNQDMRMAARSPDIPPKLPTHQPVPNTDPTAARARLCISSGEQSSPRTPIRFVHRNVSDVSMESALLVSPRDYCNDSDGTDDSESRDGSNESESCPESVPSAHDALDSDRSAMLNLSGLVLESRNSFIAEKPQPQLRTLVRSFEGLRRDFEVPLRKDSPKSDDDSDRKGCFMARQRRYHSRRQHFQSQLQASSSSLDALPMPPARRGSLSESSHKRSSSCEGFSRMGCSEISQASDISPMLPLRRGLDKSNH